MSAQVFENNSGKEERRKGEIIELKFFLYIIYVYTHIYVCVGGGEREREMETDRRTDRQTCLLDFI